MVPLLQNGLGRETPTRFGRTQVPRSITAAENFHAANEARTSEDEAVLAVMNGPSAARQDHGAIAMETVMLMCAVFASLALGVLVAYGVCQTMFRLFRVHAVSAARHRSAAASQGLRVQQG